jgi:outer membrane protein OmpA-like peptidoglycan-associated protein
MKKVTLSLVVLAMGLMLTTTAQEAKKTDTNFKPGMFVGLNGGVNWFLGEANNILISGPNSNLSLGQSMGYLGRLELGYHFTPVYSLRTMFGFNQYNHYTKINAIENVNSFIGENFTADFMMNLTNLKRGYDANRKLSLSAFAGLGIAYMNDNTITTNIGGSLLRAGLQGNWHITPQWALSLIADMNFASDNTNDLSGGGLPFDMAPDLALGFSYSFAPQKETVVVEDKLEMKDTFVEEVKKDTAVVEEKKEEVVEPEIEKEVKEEVKEEKVVAPMMTENLFFAINKSDVSTDVQKETVAKIAEYMKANPSAKVVVNGYADRATGTAAVNKEVSRRRAVSVANALIKEYGIDENRILVKWYGSTVQPYKEVVKNRVVIVMPETAQEVEELSKTLPDAYKNSAYMAKQEADLLTEVFFGLNQTDVAEEVQKEAIAKIKDFVAENPDAKITVSGYAGNNIGTDEINDELSKKRAVSVANELIRSGVSMKNIKVMWYGARVQPYLNPAMSQMVIIKANK